VIIVRTEREIEVMRRAGRILAGAFDIAAPMMKPGTAAWQVDQAVEEYIRSAGAIPAFKDYPNADGVPFPASVCFSIEAEVVHGIPAHQELEPGTIVGLDIGVEYQNYFSDSARTYAIGKIDAERQKLMDVTRRCLELGIAEARSGQHLSNIGHAIQTYAEAHGCSVVRELVGHGIGRKLHEDPQIANFGPPNRGPILRKNMVLAIEPMINLGTHEVDMIGDWQVLTKDRRPSAHFEHTVVVREGDPEILTD
jgi:methionyl aminopeptidase